VTAPPEAQQQIVGAAGQPGLDLDRAPSTTSMIAVNELAGLSNNAADETF
jgi:hypothetical protein